MADHRALGVEPHRGAVLGGDARAPDPIEGGRRVRHLDEGGKADAAMDTAPAQIVLLGAQGRVVHHGDDLVERRMMRQ
jgi:hypothetical protein